VAVVTGRLPTAWVGRYLKLFAFDLPANRARHDPHDTPLSSEAPPLPGPEVTVGDGAGPGGPTGQAGTVVAAPADFRMSGKWHAT
jgi:hypothetical protein